jgi:cyclopropane-fatty-acyl-phospholipid synthase
MNTNTASTRSGFCIPPSAPAAARTALKLLQRLKHGSLTLQLPDGSMQALRRQPHPALPMRRTPP